MFWWIVLWVILGILGLIALVLLLPVGVRIHFVGGELKLWCVAGRIRIPINLKKSKKKKPDKKTKTKAKPVKEEKKEQPLPESDNGQPAKAQKKSVGKKQQKKKSKFDYRELLREPIEANRQFDGAIGSFLAEMITILELVGVLCHRLRFRRVELNLRLAGGDPDALARLYGRAWAALGNVLPVLEEVFVIKKRDLNVECDFLGDKTVLDAKLETVLVLGEVLYCLLRYILVTPKKILMGRKEMETVD